MTDDVTPPSRLWRQVGVYALLAFFIVVLATQVRWGESLDARGASSMGSHARWWMQHIDGATVPLMCLLGLVALLGVVIQAMRGNVECTVRAVILVAGTQLMVEVLKHVIHREDNALNATPSGHSSLAASLALVVASVYPQARVRVVALAIAGFVAYGTIIGGWHTPGDVVAACAITGFWSRTTGLYARRPTRTAGALSIGGGMLAASAGLHPNQARLVPAALSFIVVWLSLYMPLQTGITHTPRERT